MASPLSNQSAESPLAEQEPSKPAITQLQELAQCADYSLLAELTPDPQATSDGHDHYPRQVFSGHYVPVKPTAIANPEYIAHSTRFFNELGLADSLAQTDAFMRLFSGDLSKVPFPMKKIGWATGYALSIYGTEYIQQCPFQTGNGYGDGRAVSVLEAVLGGKRWEMQLKGGGRTPYCRGADGRAVLRSSIREFLAQEHMHAMGVPTSRSLSLYVSQSEAVNRAWYADGSRSDDPDIMMSNPVAITTRVAPSFLRVGQLELFGRRTRSEAYSGAQDELEQIFLHLIKREYSEQIGDELPLTEKLVKLASEFRDRLTSLVTHWMRIGYCQGNFNSDNCAAGGFTLDYGPFGFCEQFDPYFQPWTGGGQHFSFFNQMAAAQMNYNMFCKALAPLLEGTPSALSELAKVQASFASVMEHKIDAMWATKLGMDSDHSDIFMELIRLMMETGVDYNVFFRELSNIPKAVTQLSKSFYQPPKEQTAKQWAIWLTKWRDVTRADENTEELSAKMKRVNPKYTWREWLVVPAYQKAMHGDYSLIHELQQVLSNPYDEQSKQIEDKYYQLRPSVFFNAGGVSHYNCSS